MHQNNDCKSIIQDITFFLINLTYKRKDIMPLIRIDLPEGVSNDDKEKIQKKVREVVLKTLAPKQVRYDYVSIRESFGIIGDGLPVVDVDLRPGREPERKKGLVDGISSVLKDILDIDPEDVYCIFRETPAHNHYTGGEPLPDWVPADK